MHPQAPRRHGRQLEYRNGRNGTPRSRLYKEKFLTGEFMLGAFLHALWRDTEGLCDGTTPRHSHAARFHADVVGSCGSRLNTKTLAGSAKAGINGRPYGDSVIGLRSRQFPRWLPRPERKDLEDAFLQPGSIENTSIKKNGIGNQNATGSSGDRSLLACARVKKRARCFEIPASAA